MIKSNLQKILSENLKDFRLSNSYGHRTVGDKIESDCSSIVKKHFIKKYAKARSKKSIEDFTIIHNKQNIFCDVKTHFLQGKKGFSMPNLVSVKKLKKLLESDNESLIYVFVDYARKNGIVEIKEINIKYVWELHWDMLRIGALGKGQLQIKNANNDLMFTNIGKDKWFSILNEKVIQFYNKEIIKIKKELKSWK
jgi:hypothetical protein